MESAGAFRLFHVFWRAGYCHRLHPSKTGIELVNHWWGLIIVHPPLTVPFCTWIMIGYFASIPKELDEAARGRVLS